MKSASEPLFEWQRMHSHLIICALFDCLEHPFFFFSHLQGKVDYGTLFSITDGPHIEIPRTVRPPDDGSVEELDNFGDCFPSLLPEELDVSLPGIPT